MTSQQYDLLFEKYLRNECSQEEIILVENWVNEQVLENINSNESIELNIVEEKLWNKIEHSLYADTISNYKKTHILKFSRTKIFWTLGGLAACLVLVMIIFRFNFPKEISSLKHGIESKNFAGKVQKVILPDNSVVLLEKNATLITDENYGKTNRTVYLEGEAFFEVTSNPQKPFLVFSNGLVTEVLGTKFRIKRKPNSNIIEVSVQKGKVSVYASENKRKGSKLNGVILTANQKVIFDIEQKTIQQGIVEKPIIIPQEFLKKDFVFDEVSLEVLIKTLENAYGVEIIVSNSSLKECVFTGDLNNLSLFKQLDLVCGSLNAQYETRGTSIFIAGEGCNKINK